jgi:hypothetical protein
LCLLVSGFLLLPVSVHADDDARAAYKAAFSKFARQQMSAQLVPVLVRNGVPEDQAKQKVAAFIDGSIECHMTSMDLNSARLTRPVYEVIENGGSYPDAKMEFELRLQKAVSEDDREIVEPFQAGFEQGQACVAEIRQELGL